MALDLTDKTANGNDLTNSNAVADVTTSLATITGNTDAGGFTAASSQSFQITNAAVLKPAGNFTIEAWIKSSTTVTNMAVFQSYQQNTNIAGISFQTAGDNKIRIRSGKNTGAVQVTDFEQVTSATTVIDGAWHHVAGVYDGAHLIVYVDGVADGTSASWTNAAAYDANNKVRIGCLNVTGADVTFWDGNIDEIRVWNAARTAQQISDNKGVQLVPAVENSLVGYWPLNAISGIANGLDLTSKMW